jgi:cell division protein FtsB
VRWLTIALFIILLLLQIRLWSEYREVGQLRAQVEEQAEFNRELAERNAALAAEVESLRTGVEAIEERARTELGLVKPGEVFYQVVEESTQ